MIKDLTIIKIGKNKYFLRIPGGKKLIESLKEFHKKVGVKFAHVSSCVGGGLRNIEAHFSKSEKLGEGKINKITISGPAELLCANVNFTEDKNGLVVHCHATFANDDDKLSAFGGHIVEAEVGLTAELIIETSNVEVNRDTEDRTGLPLKLTSKGFGKLNINWWIFIPFMIVVVWLLVVTVLLIKKIK